MNPHTIMLIIWVGAAVLFFIGEMITEGFALAWFGIGAVLAAILALLKLPIWLQITVFAVVSGVLFFLSRTIFKRLTKKAPSSGVGSERLIGRIGIVVERIDPMTDEGKVRVYKEVWRANSADNKPIETGTAVEVVGLDGVHLVIKPKEE
jgi:membrane protein implicated in regulation of membrane protease activity